MPDPPDETPSRLERHGNGYAPRTAPLIQLRGNRRYLTWALVVVAVLATGCGDAVDGHAVTLTGRWQSADYECPTGVRHHEVLDVVQHGVRVVATKVVGDKCVAARHRSFQGTVTGTSGRVDFWLSSPGVRPTIAIRGAVLAMTGPDRFTIALPGVALAFARLGARPPPARSLTWLWIVLLVVVVLVVVLVVVVGVVRRRRVSGATASSRGGHVK